MKKLLVSIAIYLLPVNEAAAQEIYSRVKIAVASPAIREFILNRLNVDHYHQQSGVATLVLNSEEMNRLRASGYPYRLITADVVQETIELNRHSTSDENVAAFQGNGCKLLSQIIPVPSMFGTGGSLRLGATPGNPGYFTYAEMAAKMNALESAYPTLVDVFSIGNSANGNPIYAVKISGNVSATESEAEVLFTGLQHAREAIGGTSLIFFMQYLAEHYNTDSRIKQLVDNRAIYIIPCVNPDGYMFNYGGSSGSYPVTGGGLWRKNRRNTGGGAANIGVDLNRNYGIDWGNCSGATSSCGSNVKTDDTYYGTSAFSEPETQAIRNFVQSRHFVTAIDQHCFGPYYSLPYGRPTLHPPFSPADSAFYTRIPALMGLFNGHRAGNSPQTVNYEVAGGIKDWLLMGDIGSGTGPKGKVFGMTGEAGGDDFWAPVSQIIPLCRELCFQNLQLAYAAGDYYELEDRNDIAINCNNGKFGFQLRKTGLGNAPVTVSLIPLENIQSTGPPISVTLSGYNAVYTDSIAYSLFPNFLGGQQVKFAWQVESGGIIRQDTITKFYNPLTILADDMEGVFSNNWTATISPSGPTGWSFTSLQAYEGTRSLTESPTGNYTSSSTRTVTYKNNFNLADASKAYLSFWVKHRAENFRDKLQVQLSTNGTSWTPICGTNTVMETNATNGGTLGGQPALTGIRENWTHELFDLGDYTGFANVYFRLQFSSDNDAGSFAFEKDDGFYIDNLKLVKVTNVTTLPVKFVTFNAKLLQNNTVQLNWEAFTDEHHDHFEVERRTGRSENYLLIGIVNGLPPYQAFDLNPEEGNNYYRIKQVEKNGNVHYSNIINIQYAPGYHSAIIYPNPVKKIMTVKITHMEIRENLKVSIMDASGQVVHEQNSLAGTGTAEIRVNLQKLPPQVYFLKVYNIRRQVLVSEKFVKSD
jgi:hypothetical protein